MTVDTPESRIDREPSVNCGDIAAALRSHPCVVDAHVADLAGEDGATRRVAWVVPERSGFRVPAVGNAELIADDGTSYRAQLCDASFDGIRMRAEGALPPTGVRMQAQLEAEAIGPGVVGCLGTVCWQRGAEFGFAFDTTGTEVGVLGLVQSFAAQHGDAPPEESPVGARTRIAIDLPCDLSTPGGTVLRLRTVDVSPTGVGLVGEVGRDLLGQGVEVTLRVVDGEHRRIRGCVTRQSKGRLGIALAPSEDDGEWLTGMVEMAIRTRIVSQDVLRHWIRLTVGADDAPERILVVERLQRAASGEIERTGLPCPFSGAR